MAATGLKVISYAYKDMPLKQLNEMMHSYSLESAEFRAEIESDLVYLCTFGLEDPLRESIQDTVQLIKFGNIAGIGASSTVNIKMVTGDHIETARYVAVQAGIISELDSKEDGVIMTGEDFMNAIGPYERLWNEEKEDYDISFDNEDLFNHVRKKVKVIARTSSEDKFVLITGTKKRGGMVAMTGDSITDAEALRKADVGLCMGSGCEVAKDNSDLIILDNDFYSIYRSIKWGRAIFDNIRKFV
jgi:magnesium-transporting ATPase (P-type)